MKDHSTGTPPTFWRLFWKNGGVVPIIMAVFTVVFTVVSYSGLRTAEALQAEGETVWGKVVERETRIVRRNDRNQRVYYLTMTYPADGKEIRKRKEVSGPLYQKMQDGHESKVRYLPSDPQVVELSLIHISEPTRPY